MANGVSIITVEIANEIAKADVGARSTLRDIKKGDVLTLVKVGTYTDRDNVVQPQLELKINETPKIIKLGIKGFANMKLVEESDVAGIAKLKFNTEFRESHVSIIKDYMEDETKRQLLMSDVLKFTCVHSVTVTNFLSEKDNEPKLAPRYYNGYKKFQQERRAAMDEHDASLVNAAWDRLYMSGIKDGVDTSDSTLHDTTPIFKIG